MVRVYHRILSELLDDIVAGRIAAGAWLPTVEEIASRHACSPGAAREAVRALEERSVVEVHPGQGQQVLDSTRWTLLDREVAEAALLRHADARLLHEAVELLRLLETQAALRAAPRVTDGDLRLLAQTLEQMRDGAAADAEEQFHRTLLLLSGNRFMASTLEWLHPVVTAVRRGRAPDRHAMAVRLHERILAALLARDATATAAAIDDYGRYLAGWLRV